ncbi:MAG TPA: alpha/beta hydrolase [Herpetosiphonaceae bacterium]
MHIDHQWHTVNGVRLHCAVAGNGPLLLLLHGFPEFWYSWRHQIPVLAEHFTVVAPDLRGYNDSDKPPRISDYTTSILVEDVVQLIHSFGYERAIVAGHDWGGAIAWSTALARPDVVEKLIVLNIPHPRLFTQHLLTNPRQRLRSWYILAFQVPRLPEMVLRANNYQAIEESFRGMAVHKEVFSDEVIAEYKRALDKPGALTSAINYYRALTRSASGSFWLDIDPVAKMPVMLIWGEQDTALGKELNRELERYVPNLTKHFIPDASHWVQQDRPDLVNQYMLSFLV